jgi:hypothetical protein
LEKKRRDEEAAKIAVRFFDLLQFRIGWDINEDYLQWGIGALQWTFPLLSEILI